MTFQVKIEGYEDLSPTEQEGAADNGSGKEYASYIRISINNGTRFLESDAMEPEDARFYRDLSWIKEAVELAYRTGVVDGEQK